MKKAFAVLLCLCMLSALLVACGNEPPAGEETVPETTTESEATTVSETEPATTPETETVPETETEPAPETVPETETEAETEPETEPETLPETDPGYETDADGNKLAGSDSGIVRDGTPKKYFTIRMDDGITQDERIMEILKKYNTDCITFYANSSLFGTNWAWVGESAGRPDVTHIRYSRHEFADVYEGFDVGVHTKNHPSLKNLTDAQVTDEVEGDRLVWARILDYTPVGMAWPGGDTEWNERSIETVLATTNIRFGSCTTSTNSFKLPQYFMQWRPTCPVNATNLLYLAQKFIDAEPTEDMLFYVWGHGYELDLNNSWDTFEQLIKMITEAAAEDDSIVLVTNSEFYQLFKDEIPSWKNSDGEDETEPSNPIDPADYPLWNETKDVVVHLSFDELRPNGNTDWNAGVFHPINGGSIAWDHVASVSSEVTFLQFFGWIGTKDAEIGTFGYQIDDGEPIWDAAFTHTTGSDVINAATGSFGASNASRMQIDIDLAGLSGEHTVSVCYKDPSGSIVLLDAFLVMLP